MKILTWKKENLEKIAGCFGSGMVTVLPSETLYGLMGTALNKSVVEQIYKIKGRSPDKPCIILISKIENLDLFGVSLTAWQKDLLKKYWPGKVSVILECTSSKFEYLHRGTKTLAFRLPNKLILRQLIDRTGPLVAPSANPESKKPALTIAEAKNYFGSQVDLYVDSGELSSPPSTVVSLVGDKVEVLRGKL